jgi:hypothetical protein
MFDSCDQACLALEAFPVGEVILEVAGDQFDCHIPAKVRVMRKINHSHSPASQFGFDFISCYRIFGHLTIPQCTCLCYPLVRIGEFYHGLKPQVFPH